MDCYLGKYKPTEWVIGGRRVKIKKAKLGGVSEVNSQTNWESKASVNQEAEHPSTVQGLLICLSNNWFSPSLCLYQPESNKYEKNKVLTGKCCKLPSLQTIPSDTSWPTLKPFVLLVTNVTKPNCLCRMDNTIMNLFLCKEKPRGIGRWAHTFKAQNHSLSCINCGSGKFSVITHLVDSWLLSATLCYRRLESNEETHSKSSPCKYLIQPWSRRTQQTFFQIFFIFY